MREILFRGKGNPQYNTGEWQYGFIGIDKDGDYYIHGSCWSRTVLAETVGQYTGLTDKNGTKIFEGDIVKVTYTGRNKGLDGIAPVVFDGCMFGLVWGWHKELHCLSGFSNVEFEVIGNIHDNPELLKGGADNGL